MVDGGTGGGVVKTVDIKTQGFNELMSMFSQLPESVASQVLATGVNAGARVIAKAAKRAAPDYTGHLSPKATAAHQKYGKLKTAIKAKGLRRKYSNVRAAVVTRGGAFWGDFHNRGSRYQPASHWYDTALSSVIGLAQETQKRYMVAKIIQVSLKAIQRAGANKS